MGDVDDQFEITAHPQNAAAARERVKRAAAGFGFSRAAQDDIEIAVGEAVTNAILYGSPLATSQIAISTAFDSAGDVLHVEVRDQGHGFDPANLRDEDDHDSLGGRGVRLMRALMDEVSLHYNGDGMIVRLSRKC